MNRFLVLTLASLVLLGILAGCSTPPPKGDENRTCSANTDCVPEQCCHPTSCINLTHKGVCTELCTNVCQGPIDCGAGHCECGNGTCQVVPGPSP